MNKNILKLQVNLKKEIEYIYISDLKKPLTKEETTSLDSLKMNHINGKFNIEFKESTDEFHDVLKKAIKNIMPSFLENEVIKSGSF